MPDKGGAAQVCDLFFCDDEETPTLGSKLRAVMLGTYYPILAMGVVAGLIVVGMVVAARLLGPRRHDESKLSAYECGMWPEGDARRRIAVKFYVVAMLFILFDVEAAFFYPWAVLFNQLELFGIIEMAVFFSLLAAAYIYVWRAGGFEWD